MTCPTHPLSLTLPLAIALAATLTACGGSAQLDCPNDPTDTDGDGLTDCEEIELGTAVLLADTDGDGFSDHYEVVGLGFSPDNNNFKFNPRIADTPRVYVRVSRAPVLGLNFAESTSQGSSYEVGRSGESTLTTTVATSESNSQAIEYTETVGGSVTTGAETSFPGPTTVSGEATVSYEESVSTSRETSHTFSVEQGVENAYGWQFAKNLSAEEGVAIDSGYVAVNVDLVNEGDIAYTLTNLALTASMTTPGLEQKNSPVGALAYDNAWDEAPDLTLGPGESVSDFIFANREIPLAVAKPLMTGATNLNVRVASYELTDDEGRSFTHNTTAIHARTATIIVDYDRVDVADGPKSTERYQVATNTDPDVLRVTVADVLSDTLQMPFTVSADGSLESVRDVAEDAEDNGRWSVVYKTTDGRDETIEHFTGRDSYDFEAMELKSGDLLHLVYVSDADHDGLGSRLEAAYGTDPEQSDTDGDGIEDGEEVNEHLTSPTRADTDGDGISDADEIDRWGTDPRTFDEDGNGIADGRDHFSMVSAGGSVVALTASGEVWQWTDDPTMLAEKPEDASWTGVRAGYGIVYAWDDTGATYASTTRASDLVPTLADHDFVALSTDPTHTLAIDSDGSLWQWRASQAPVRLGADTDWASVEAGNNASWAIKTDGSLWAWGENSHGLYPDLVPLGLGFGSVPEWDLCAEGDVLACFYIDEPVRLGNGSDWVSVSASTSHALAIKADGTLWAWGSGTAVGHDTSRYSVEIPTQVGTDTDWATAAASSSPSTTDHSLAIKTDGTLWSWGDGATGVLGHGDRADVAAPKQVGTATNWTEVHASTDSSAALRDDGTLWTWGSRNLAHEASLSPKPVLLIE